MFGVCVCIHADNVATSCVNGNKSKLLAEKDLLNLQERENRLRMEVGAARQKVLVLEDLGKAERLDAALARGAEVGAALVALAGFLAAVHRGTAATDLAGRFPNDAMRRLHGEHIFELPLRENFYLHWVVFGRYPDHVQVWAAAIDGPPRRVTCSSQTEVPDCWMQRSPTREIPPSIWGPSSHTS